MKTKIAGIAIITIVVLTGSIFTLQKTIRGVSDESYLLTSNIKNRHSNYQEMVEVPVFRQKVLSATRQTSIYSEPAYTASSALQGKKSANEGFHSTSAVFVPESGISSRNSSGRNNIDNQSASMMPLFSHKPAAMEGLIASNRVVRADAEVSTMAEPFSSPVNTGPARMVGDGENPPGEGAPVGSGTLIFLFLSLIYVVYYRMKQ